MSRLSEILGPMVLLSGLFGPIVRDRNAFAYSQIAIVEPPPSSEVSGTTPIIVSFALPDNDPGDVTHANVFEDGRFLGTVTRKAATLWWDTRGEPNGEPATIVAKGFTRAGVLVGYATETVRVFNQ